MVSCKRGHVFLHHAAAYIVARGLVFTVVTGAVFSNGASGTISLRIFLTSKTVRSRFDIRGGEQLPVILPAGWAPMAFTSVFSRN